MQGYWIIVAVVTAVVLLAGWQYNNLVRMRQLMKNAWADVDVFLKRRADLIPNLVETVKGYGNYEQAALEKVVEARSAAVALPGPSRKRELAEVSLTQGIAGIFAYAEAYPDLKASEGYRKLQDELSETETKIASARQYYNACVRDWNTLLESFPSALFGIMAGMRKQPFFELDSLAERDAPSAAVS